jgi:hypothetical protein
MNSRIQALIWLLPIPQICSTLYHAIFHLNLEEFTTFLSFQPLNKRLVHINLLKFWVHAWLCIINFFFFFYRLCVNSKIWAVFSRAFLDRWLEETNNFALRVGEMTMTLDDVTCLLHLTFQGRLMDHTTLTKVNSVNMIGFVLRMLHSTGHPAAWLPLLERLSIQWVCNTQTRI